MTPNPLAGIGYCVCGYALCLHRRRSSSGKLHTYVRCGGGSLDGCRGSVRLDEIETLLEEKFLDAYGDREMERMVFVPGEDHSRELAQTEQSLERLRWESDNGLVDDEDLYRSRLAALVTRKKELTAETVIPARWEPVGTGGRTGSCGATVRLTADRFYGTPRSGSSCTVCRPDRPARRRCCSKRSRSRRAGPSRFLPRSSSRSGTCWLTVAGRRGRQRVGFRHVGANHCDDN